jgi:4-hydroxy-tetrahydrodipicolinate reductase
MGARLCALAAHDPQLEVVGAVDAGARQDQPATDAERATAAPVVQIALNSSVFCDVVIDFSSDAGAADAARLAAHRGAALLVGTTGLSAGTVAALTDAAQKIPVLISANTSAGVAVAAEVVRRIASLLGGGADVSIVESHHAGKRDAPSGTALRLADAVVQGGATIRNDQILSIRGGDVIGEHTVRFACEGELIELTHRATSRDLFVRSALRAARWLATQPAGLYTIEDMLFGATPEHDRA